MPVKKPKKILLLPLLFLMFWGLISLGLSLRSLPDCSHTVSPAESKAIQENNYTNIILQPRLIDQGKSVLVCVDHISDYVKTNVGTIKSLAVYRNGVLLQENLDHYSYFTDRDLLTGPLDYTLVYNTTNGNFISEPSILRQGIPNKVVVEIVPDLEVFVKSRYPQSPSENTSIVVANLHKFLNNLNYVVIDPLLSHQRIKHVNLKFNPPNYEVVVATSDKVFTQNSLQGPYVYIKYNSSLNSHEFFWDNVMMSWFFVQLLPDLSKATLDFWYNLQFIEGDNQGFIPREIRPESVANYWHSATIDGPVNPLSYLPLSSLQASAPFFAPEVELDLYKIYRDKVRLQQVYPHFIHYYLWVENHRKKVDSQTNCSYYEFSNLGSGMDNIMRGYGLHNPLLKNYAWVDLFSQQVLLAQDLEKIEHILGIKSGLNSAAELLKKEFIRCHFDDRDGLFWDRDFQNSAFIKHPYTAAGVWVLLIDFDYKERQKYLAGLVESLTDADQFGGYPFLPSVSRNDQLFAANGDYWRGGVWPPLLWVTVKGLEKNNFRHQALLAKNQSYKLLRDVFQDRETVFEYYSPSLINGNPSPGNDRGKEAAGNFYGWGSIIIPLALE